ncbi:hypothetical protein BVRB_6g142890 [Beta vulgaris subsp. vulgaris]|nr:hypothetical protein BVRB_6g142890 [Beta vulgaris subsp. vulgaris]
MQGCVLEEGSPFSRDLPVINNRLSALPSLGDGLLGILLGLLLPLVSLLAVLESLPLADSLCALATSTECSSSATFSSKALLAFPMVSLASESRISARRSQLTGADLSSQDISPIEVPAANPGWDLRDRDSTLIDS